MHAPTESTGLLDFGIGMLFGLVRAGYTTLDERRLVDVHGGFVAAFRTIEDEGHFRFWMTTDRYHGISDNVFTIFNYWLKSGYATRDSPGTIYRFRISKERATEELETLLGGAALYDKAVAAYVDYINTHHSS